MTHLEDLAMTTGSLINHAMGQSQDAVPEVGMGATELCYTDRWPFTIIEVINEKTIMVQVDHAQRTDSNGMSECQEYEFTPNTSSEKVVITRRKSGAWIRRGEPMKGGTRFLIGHRSKYHDFSF